MRRKLFILALLMFFAASSHAASTWKLVYGPSETNNTKDYQDVFVSSVGTAYATGLGSFGKTYNYGQTWTTTYDASTEYIGYKSYFLNKDLAYIVYTRATGRAYIIVATNEVTEGSIIKGYTGDANNYLYSIYFYDSNNGWACGADLGTGATGGAITKTTDGGTTWGSEVGWGSGAGGVGRDIWFTSATNGVVACDVEGHGLTNIMRTTDGGATWNPATVPALGNNLRAVCFADATTGWAVGEVGTILKTTDGGANWSALTSGTTATLAAVSCVNDQVVWVAGWASGLGGVVRLSTDGGATWADANTGTSLAHNYKGIDFIDAYNGYLAGVEGSGITNNAVVYKWVVDPTVSSVYQTGTAIAVVPQGFTGNIDINGVNVLDAPTFDAMSDITVNSVTWVNNTQVRLNVTATPGATVGSRSLVMHNPDTGVSAAYSLAVTERPQITSVDPNSKIVGWSGDVVITGTNFSTNCAVSFGSEIQVLNTVNNSTTQVTTTILIPSTATVGNHTITLTNADNGAATATFAVTAAVNPPTITGVEFNNRPYVPSSAAYPIQNINTTPTVKFNFNTTNTASPSAFKVYAQYNGALATYSVPSGDYNPTLGTVTTDIGPLTPGIVTITVYGEDTLGQGASESCTINVLDPAAATDTVSIIPHPNPCNGTEPITFQITSDTDLGACELNIVSSSGERLAAIGCTIYAGNNTVSGASAGGSIYNGIVHNKVAWTPTVSLPNGIIGVALTKDGQLVKNGGRAKLVVTR